MKKIKTATLAVIILFCVYGALTGYNVKEIYYGATNFDRLVLGSGNYGEDPNPTADITGANDEYISNVTNGSWDFGAANLTTTGTITGVLSVGATVGDTGSFQKTPDTNREKFYDTLTISGVTTSSVFIVSPRIGTIPVAGDVLSARAITGKLIVSRADTTTSVEPYSWLKIK